MSISPHAHCKTLKYRFRRDVARVPVLQLGGCTEVGSGTRAKGFRIAFPTPLRPTPKSGSPSRLAEVSAARREFPARPERSQ
jgi:hypothetical protein